MIRFVQLSMIGAPKYGGTVTRARRKASIAPRRPQKPGQHNRQRILAAGERLFAERGYSDTSIDAVAEAFDLLAERPERHSSHPEERIAAPTAFEEETR